MNELFFSITYPPIPITEIGPVAFSLHGVFAALGFYFGSTYAIKLCVKDGEDDELFSDAFTWAIFGAIVAVFRPLKQSAAVSMNRGRYVRHQA